MLVPSQVGTTSRWGQTSQNLPASHSRAVALVLVFLPPPPSPCAHLPTPLLCQSALFPGHLPRPPCTLHQGPLHFGAASLLTTLPSPATPLFPFLLFLSALLSWAPPLPSWYPFLPIPGNLTPISAVPLSDARSLPSLVSALPPTLPCPSYSNTSSILCVPVLSSHRLPHSGAAFR